VAGISPGEIAILNGAMEQTSGWQYRPRRRTAAFILGGSIRQRPIACCRPGEGATL